MGNGWNFPAVIYSHLADNRLLWYRHDGWGEGTFAWSGGNGQVVGTGWNFKQIFSGGKGVIYAVTASGDLMWYRHAGRGNGTFNWVDSNARKVGVGWNFLKVFSSGDGVIYALTEDHQI